MVALVRGRQVSQQAGVRRPFFDHLRRLVGHHDVGAGAGGVVGIDGGRAEREENCKKGSWQKVQVTGPSYGDELQTCPTVGAPFDDEVHLEGL